MTDGEVRRTASKHWSEIGDAGEGDIKGVWELSRFGWAFGLVREGGEEATAVFWELFSDWVAENPPNLGANWMCGQEASIRLMAVVVAAERLGVPAEMNDPLARLIVATGRRVKANLGYALSQKNNHGVSECVGLLTAALLVPTHDEAAGWKRDGLAALEVQLTELVYADGAFSQHSLVYHRVLLSQLCWAALRLKAAGELEPAWLVAAGRRATAFLAAITDPATGEAPLYGANDGADLLPLSACAFTDMRPAVQLGAAVFEGARRFESGPWDETARWLVDGFDGLPSEVTSLPKHWHAVHGGLFQLWHGADRLTLRCPARFEHRPSQADLGHVDVWLAGARVAIDGGSFSYNSQERFTALGTAREHNGITVDGREPMRKAMRFLYLPWPTGQTEDLGDAGLRYTPRLYPELGVAWNRSVRVRDGGGFVVEDIVSGAAGHLVRWHWRLAPGEWILDAARGVIEAKAHSCRIRWTQLAGLAVDLVRADQQSAAGWESRHYGEATQATSLSLCARIGREAKMTFEFFSS